MATNKPRITITLAPYTYEVLKSMSDSSGQTLSGIVSGLIDVSLPVLERMTKTYQQVKMSGEYQRSKMVQAMQEAQDVFEPLVLNKLLSQDLFHRQSVSSVIEDSRREARASDVTVSRPRTNRGVTPNKQQHRKPMQAKASKGVLKNEVLKKVAGKKS